MSRRVRDTRTNVLETSTNIDILYLSIFIKRSLIFINLTTEYQDEAIAN